jgi:hypothetical protein
LSTSFDRREITGWLAALGCDAPTTTTPADIEPTVAELVAIHAALAEIYRALARHPNHHAEVQQVIDRMMARRHALLTGLSEQLLSWVASGGRVELRKAMTVSPPSAELPRTASPAACLPPASVAVPQVGLDPAAASPPAALPSAASVSRRRQVVEMGVEPAPGPTTTETFRELFDPTVGRAAMPSRPVLATDDDLGDAEKGLLRSFLDAAGPPRDLEMAMGASNELDGLEAMSLTMAKWPVLPKSVQRQLLAMLVARLRAVKDSRGLDADLRGQVRQLLALCPSYATKHPVGGHVNGLQVAHAPLGGSWRGDAREYWEMLVKAAGERAG